MLFSPEHSEVKCAKLPFYKDMVLYKIINNASLPTFTMDFAGDGKQYHYLDGAEKTIYIINETTALHLTEETITPYLKFYFSNITHEDGDIYLIESLEKLPFLSSLAPEQKTLLEERHHPPKVAYNEENGHYEVISPLFYGGTLMQGKIIVDMNGHVDIKELEMLLKAQLQPHIVQGIKGTE